MGYSSQLFKGASLNLLDQAVRIVSVFVMTPIIVRSLGVESYGYWVFIMAIFGHYAVLDFGLTITVSRFFSRAIGKNDRRGLLEAVSTAMQMAFYIMLIALTVSAIIFLACPWFVEDPSRLHSVRWILALFGFYISTGFIGRIFGSLLKSHLRYDLLVTSSITKVVLANVLIYIFLMRGHGLVTLAIIHVCAGFLEYAIVIGGNFVIDRSLRIRREWINPQLRREILRFSFSAFLSNLGNLLRHVADPLILGTFVTVGAVSYYNIGSRIPIYFQDLIGAVMGGQVLVVLSRIHGSGDTDELNLRFLQLTRLCAVLATIGGFSMMLYGDSFLRRWIGPGFESSTVILLILATPYTVALMQYPSHSLLNAMAKPHYVATPLIIGGVFNIALSIFLAIRVGIYGVVWATFVEMLIVFLIVYPTIVCKVAHIAARDLFLKSLIFPSLKTLAILAPFYLLARQHLEADYRRLILLGIIQFIYFAPLCLFFLLSGAERKILIERLKLRFIGNSGADS